MEPFRKSGSGLNAIGESEAWEEIGKGREDSWKRIVRSLTHCPFPDHKNDAEGKGEKDEGVFEWVARLAPSIIARNVAEFFEVSMPRFAIRAFVLTSRGLSFVNLHRIETMKRFAFRDSEESGASHPEESTDSEAGQGEEKEWSGLSGISRLRFRALEEASGIADAVLAWPDWCDELEDLIRIETPDLPTLYGEKGGAQNEYTSYVHNLPLSGLCAQAACFIVTCMMHRWTGQVFGFSEITLLSETSSDEKNGEGVLDSGRIPKMTIELTGLDGKQIVRYFEQAGLRCLDQEFRAESLCLPNETPSWGGEALHWIIPVLRAYIRSGYPVVFPCDLGRLEWKISGNVRQDPMFLCREELSDAPALYAGMVEHPIKDRKHVIVLIGCFQRGTDTYFLYHDTSRQPYMVISAKRLLACSPYDEHYEDLSVLELPNFLPVTPAGVRLPLIPQAGERNRQGIPRSVTTFARSVLYARETYTGRTGELVRAVTRRPGEMILIPPGEFRTRWRSLVKDAWKLRRNPNLKCPSPDCFPEALESVIAHLPWVWVQLAEVLPRSNDDRGGGWIVLIWNAENGVSEGGGEENEEPENCLVGSWIIEKGDAWAALFDTESSHPNGEEESGPGIERSVSTRGGRKDRNTEGNTGPPERSSNTELNVSLISSVAAYGIQSIRKWPAQAACDLYAFMAQDISLLTPDGHIGEIGPVEFFERQLKDPDLEKHLLLAADRVSSVLTKVGAPLPPVAMATYVPEISCVTPSLRQAGRSAIEYLIRLGGKLRMRGGEDLAGDTRTESPLILELVGGSLAQSIYPEGKDEKTGRSRFWANIQDSGAALQSLVETLLTLGECAREAGVVIALEFEPGLLNILGHYSHVVELCELLDDCGESADFIGINLDIAHFQFLAGVSVERIRKDTAVLNRIVHAHVSDHADSGHFGDAEILSIHGEEWFRPWFELLAEIKKQRGPEVRNRDQGVLPFSGYVSIELEACGDELDYHSTLREVSRMCRGERQ